MPSKKPASSESTAKKARRAPRSSAPDSAPETTAVRRAAPARRKAKAAALSPDAPSAPPAQVLGGDRGYDLVIVESPAKAKTINKYLGPGFKVMASFGHVRDLATNKDRKTKEEVAGIQISKGWKLRYLVDAGAKAKAKAKTKAARGGKSKFKRRTQQEIVDELAQAAAQANRVLLASDPDREGESIAWHIADELKLDPARTYRIRFNEITKSAIQQALVNIAQIDMDRVRSQEARRAMDRVVGFPLSNILGKKVAAGLSAGRVQSVAVKLIVDRDAEIEAFKTEEYWRITALLAPQGSGIAWKADVARSKIFAKKAAAKGEAGETKPAENDSDIEDTEVATEEAVVAEEAGVADATPAEAARPTVGKAGIPVPPQGSFLAELARWNEAEPQLASEADADAIAAVLNQAAFVVSRIEQKDRNERPQAPFTTSTLQQQANIRLRFTTRRTMDSAQRLYQGVDLGKEGTIALITYMRTDSTRISPDALNSVRDYIKATFGQPYCPEKPNFYASGKSAQEAHECIRPTDVTMTPDRVARLGLSGDDLKLYTLIYNRFVACQMSPAVFAVTSVEVAAGPGLLRATGRIEKFDGYRRVMAPTGKSEDVTLPPLAEKQTLDKLDLFETQHFTQPPPRYNEASLVKALEKEGIGRPSTYASIISTIQDRGYVEQRDRRFFATQIGKVVTGLLVAHFPKIMDLKFTSHFEEELDEIETGKYKYQDVLDEFWKDFSVLLDKADTDMPAQRGIETGEPCPKCTRPLVWMFSPKTGNRFIGCSAWKDKDHPCPYKRGEDGRESMGPEVTTIPCPACGNFMIKRDGRFGTFFTCEAAPDCKTIMNQGDDGQVRVSTIASPHPCPQCQSPMLLKFARTGSSYLNCTDSKCKYTVDADKDGQPVPPPETGILCEKCQSPLTIKKSFRGPFLACTGYPKCRNAKSINAELREKLKHLLPPPEPKKSAAKLPSVPIEDACPDCGSPMALKKYLGRYFLGCTKYPDCRGTRQPTPELLAQISAAAVGA